MGLKRNFTLIEQYKIYVHYKISIEFSMYDLVFYNMDNSLPFSNTVFRNELLKQKDTKNYNHLQIATKPFLEKMKVSSFDEFCSEHNEEFKRNRNYNIQNINDWYDRYKHEFDF